MSLTNCDSRTYPLNDVDTRASSIDYTFKQIKKYIRIICKGLKNTTTISSLKWNNEQITKEVKDELGDAILNNHLLLKLHFNQVQFSDDHNKYFFYEIYILLNKKNLKLKEIYLQGIKRNVFHVPRYDCLGYIGHALRNNNWLLTLRLERCNIDNEILDYLVPKLCDNTKLCYLSLKDNNISSADIIADNLHLLSIECLDLSDNKIERGIARLVRNMIHYKKL